MTPIHPLPDSSINTVPVHPGDACPPVGSAPTQGAADSKVAGSAEKTLQSAEALAAAAMAEDDGLEDYIAELMKRLGTSSSGTRSAPSGEPAAGRRRAEAHRADLPEKPGSAQAQATKPLRPERVERPPEKAEMVSAMRDVANDHARTMLKDHERKRGLSILQRRWFVAIAASLCVPLCLAFSRSDADIAHGAAWGAHLVAIIWTIRFWAMARNLRTA